MKWRKMLSMLFISFVAISSIFSFAVFSPNTGVSEINKNEIIIEFRGHVQYPGKYNIPKGTSLGSIIFKTKPLFGSDLTKFNLDQILNENQVFDISNKTIQKNKNSTQNEKIYWKNIQSIEDFLKLKISKRISQILWNLRKEKKIISWSELASTAGIGKISLEKLRNSLILD